MGQERGDTLLEGQVIPAVRGAGWYESGGGVLHHGMSCYGKQIGEGGAELRE